MGKMIRQLAVEQGHKLGCIIDNESDWKTKAAELKSCDVAIDFSIPAAAFDNLSRCFALKLPIVIGPTVWRRCATYAWKIMQLCFMHPIFLRV